MVRAVKSKKAASRRASHKMHSGGRHSHHHSPHHGHKSGKVKAPTDAQQVATYEQTGRIT